MNNDEQPDIKFLIDGAHPVTDVIKLLDAPWKIGIDYDRVHSRLLIYESAR